MINFYIENKFLLLEYEPNNGYSNWIFEHLQDHGKVLIKGTFNFSRGMLHSKFPNRSENFDYDAPVEFVVGKLKKNYFKFDKEVLSTKNNVFIYHDFDFQQKYFIAGRKTSIFKKIDNLVNEDIYIGGDAPNTLPENEFKRLITRFPNEYELQKYIEARIGSVLRNFFDTTVDSEKAFNNYMNKKDSYKGKNLIDIFLDVDLKKLIEIQDKIEFMLQNEDQYNEKQWQYEILQIILLLYPKYIQVFNEVPVNDSHCETIRKIDFLLVDSNGNIDIVEIKRPFGNSIVSNNQYRDNYIPLRELSGTIMQIEKYIFNLTKWGNKGERILTKRYKERLPSTFNIKITNPSGIIIMGRDNQLNYDQLLDFEVIRRKYKNIIDIITYDDLLRRLKFTIKMVQSKIDTRPLKTS